MNLLPGLPAYILFMCIRHTDFINDDEKVCTCVIRTPYSAKRYTEIQTSKYWVFRYRLECCCAVT